MRINEISTVDEEWYNPLTWFKKKPKATTKAVAKPEVKTVSPDLMPGDGLANQAANHIANNKNKKKKALDAFKKELGEDDSSVLNSINELINDIHYTNNHYDRDEAMDADEINNELQQIKQLASKVGNKTIIDIVDELHWWNNHYDRDEAFTQEEVNAELEKIKQLVGGEAFELEEKVKEVSEGDMEADKKNPHAQPYLNTPE
ncbi:uncharacterized protein METZ01_LOCUS287859, partial [marine metagenome]